jgi:hypothetical protein
VWPRTRENLGDNKPTTEKKRTFEVADPRGESSKCPVCDSRSGDIKNRVGSEKTDRVCIGDSKKSLHEALSRAPGDGGHCRVRDGRSEDQGALTTRLAMSTRFAMSCRASPLLPPSRRVEISRRIVASSPSRNTRAHLPTPLTSLAVVLGGRGRPPQGRGEVRLGQVAVHPEGRAPVQDPASALERGLEGAQIARPLPSGRSDETNARPPTRRASAKHAAPLTRSRPRGSDP